MEQLVTQKKIVTASCLSDSGSHDDAGALWLNSDNKIVFEQGAGNEVMRVANSKLGIGATNPLKAAY